MNGKAEVPDDGRLRLDAAKPPQGAGIGDTEILDEQRGPRALASRIGIDRRNARRPIGSSSSLAAGEMSAAKSVSDNLDFPTASRAAAFVVASERFTRAASGKELNSETKLTAQT